ncbi:Zinc finger homeobox protein 3 [Schistosoma haematobium]|uniref:Zinc finger homeobox protein 3 n=1 Tax=Schistosoma haematobium TaxID=6185 RepID=A0A922LRX9_SCHHA|nr:Zinc finger homeobox protein 3 [Schistosoma haematobium]KAH9592045.1 Zinc finger homeobox protein 3 [Schistosoma haematobium]
MNKTFTKLAFSKHSNPYSSSGQLKYSSSLTMLKQQQSQTKESNGVSTNSCLYCVTKTAHPRLGRGETYICGYKPYRCEICNYSTTTKGNLAIHQQSDKHLNNLQEHEQTMSQTIFNTADTRSNHSESPDCTRHQQNNLHQNLAHLNSASKKSNSSCDLNILTAQSLSERRTVSSLQQNMKLNQKTVEFLQQKNENEKVIDNININKAITNFHELGLANGEDRMHQPSYSSYSSSVIDSSSFCYDHPLKTFIPLTSSHDNLLCNLTETANHPLACQVCCTFTTDNLDVLIEHVERNRVPFDLDYVTNLITLHTNGFWFCKLCSYKSPLKANFQLHCKTEKHAQRLSFLVHVCEGGLWNQSRILSTLNICENKILDISNNNNIQCSITKGPNYNISSLNITTNLTTHNNNSSNVGNNSSNCNNVKNNFTLTSSIQLYCIACDLFTTSVHKFRLHCQTLSHIGAVKIFTHLVNRRNYLWNILASLSLFYVDFLKSLIDENDNDDKTNNTHTDSSLNSMNNLKYQTKFNKILLQLSSILTNLQVVYVCHKNYLPFIPSLTNCSSPSSSSPNINLMSSDKSSQQPITRFKSLTSALNHWHVSEHQRSIAKQQLFTDHENVSQYNQINDSNYYSNEIFDIHWQLNDIEGNIEELPTTIIKILIPIINESINKQSMNSNEYNTLINNSIINDIELINSRQMSNYNIKNTMNNMKENEENNCNNELIYDKMKIIDLSYEQDSNNKTDQQYEMIVNNNNEQINNKKFKLLSEYIGHSDRKLISSFHQIPTTNISEDNHLPTFSATGSNNVGDINIPFSPTRGNGEQATETEAIRCHSQINSSAIDQNFTEDLTNATKYKLQPCNELNRTVISIKSLTNDWPTRPNSEPILKLTNHNSLEFEIDSKFNLLISLRGNSIIPRFQDKTVYKNIMTANAFLSSNCTVEDNVSASRLFLPKELHISDEWRKSEQRLTASNTSNMSSPIHNFNICGTSVTPMELFAQMTAHYKQISENYNYAQSMELFLTNPSVITQLASMNMSKITEPVSTSTSISQPPPSSPSSSAFTLTPLTAISKPSNLPPKQIDDTDLPTNHNRMSTNDFFHEFNMLPNLHSLLKQSFELISCDSFSNIQNDKYFSEELLAFTLEVIVNDKVYYGNIYEKLNNHWFKLEYIRELQMKKGKLCTYCCNDNYDDNNDDDDDNVSNEMSNDDERNRKYQNKSHRFLLESSSELHIKLQHSKQISNNNNDNPLTIILSNSSVNDLVEKLNLLISNSAFSDLFHSSLENHCKLQPSVKSSSPNLLSMHLKHIQSDSFQNMPKSVLQTNEIEFNDTNTSASFIVEQNFSAKNLATDNNTTKNDISNICDSNTPLSLSVITSDQSNLLHKDIKDSIVNSPFETITNNICSNNSNLLLNYTLTNKNDPNENNDNNQIDKDNKMNKTFTESYFSSIKDYSINNSTNLLPKLYSTTQHERTKFIEPYEQQITSSSSLSLSSLQKRSRTRLSESQLNILRSYFDINNSPSDEKIYEICNKTGLQEKVVKHWFRNTLFKERQKNKDNPYNFSIPPSTSLNIEEYEKTGRIEVHSTHSMKQHHKLYHLNIEQIDKQNNNNLQFETTSQDLTNSSNINNDIENENINIIGSLNSPTKSLTSTIKRSCEMESLKNIDQMKWINQNKRQRLQKDIQDSSMNDERPTSIVSIEDSDVIYNYKRNLRSTMTTTTTTTPSTENTDGDVHSFVLADNSNNSHESPPSITSESSPSISETPLSPRLPMIPELDNPQSVLAALIHLGHHNRIQQQSKSESEQKSINLWEFPYFSSTSLSSSIRGFSNGTEVYTDPNKLHCQLTSLMNASLNRTMPHFQTSPDSNEAPLDLSAKTTPSVIVNSTGDNNCQNSSSFILEQNAQIMDNEDNNDFTANNQDQFLSVPSLIQTEHVSGVYRSTSTTSSTNGGRRNRTSITALQSRCMHSIYNYHKTPSVHECDRLGEMIGLSRRVVQVWFQNQRAKEKKMARVSSGQYNFSVNSSLLTEKSSPIDSSSCIDSNYCQICSISIQKSEITNNSMLTNQQATNACNQSTNFTSHASFVDHLFSAVHLKKLLRWCTMDTT